MLDKILEEEFFNGQGQFYDLIKKHLYFLLPDIFKILDFEDDTNFTDPTLFLLLANQKKNFIHNFPKYLEKTQVNFEVHSDRMGEIFISGFGIFTGLAPQTKYVFHIAPNYELQSSHRINYSLKPIFTSNVIKDLEITSNLDLLLENLLLEFPHVLPEDIIEMQENRPEIEQYIKTINEALHLVQMHLPKDFKFYSANLKRIYLLSSNKIRNFTTSRMFGAIFLNVEINNTVPYFFEEIIHQASHNIFNAVLFDPMKYFKIDPYQTLQNFNNNNDSRTLFSAFHGVYTTVKITQSLLILHKRMQVDDVHYHEVLGRLAINKNRVDIGLEQIHPDLIFTKTGKFVFNELYNDLKKMIRKNKLAFSYKVENQPVIFNLETFLKENFI